MIQPPNRHQKGDQWYRRLVRSRRAYPLLFLLSFLESTVLPVPLEIGLIPYMIAARDRVWRIATIALAGCVAGALAGYGLGYLFMQTAGDWLIGTFNWGTEMTAFREWFREDGFWAVFAVGVTPIPFQVAMLSAGGAQYPLALFLLATALSRGLRYYGLALLVVLFGSRAADLWKRHGRVVGVTLLGFLLLAYLAARFLLSGSG